jgi:hypothetical protein
LTKQKGNFDESSRDNIFSLVLEVGDLGTFLFGKNLISRTTMQNSQRSPFSSGQPPQQQQQPFVRPQGTSSGIPPSRQQYPRTTQPNEHLHNANYMPQQQQTRVGSQNMAAQQYSNVT